MAPSGRRPGIVAVAAVALSAARLLAGAPPATADLPARGFTGGAQGYLRDDGRFRTIAFPGATGTLPFGINDRGQIVGVYDDAGGRSHGFLWERDRFRTLDIPGATDTFNFDINNRGQITLQGTSAAEPLYDFVLDDGEFTRVQFPRSGGDPGASATSSRATRSGPTPCVAPSCAMGG